MTQPLSYAPAAPSRRRFYLRLLIVAVALIALAWPGYRLFMFGSDRIQLLRMDHTCRTFTASPQATPYTEVFSGPVDFPLGGAYDSIGSTTTSTGVGQMSHREMMVGAIDRLYGTMLPGRRMLSPGMQATLFLHERTSPNGQRRIVAVTLDGNLIHFSLPNVQMTATVIVAEPLGWFRPAVPKVGSMTLPLGEWPAPPTRTVFHAGQPDPSDASRFTIGYQFGEQSGVIEGRLTDAGSVVLWPASGPLVRGGK